MVIIFVRVIYFQLSLLVKGFSLRDVIYLFFELGTLGNRYYINYNLYSQSSNLNLVKWQSIFSFALHCVKYFFSLYCRELQPSLAEAVSSILWVAPRMESDIPELKVISEQIGIKVGKKYVEVSIINQLCDFHQKCW